MKILISAYASEPGAGSEYGVGWMVPLTMAQKYPEHQIYVLTRSRCREKIEQTLKELALPNLHFLFYDIPKWMCIKNEMKTHWGEQINYLLWQLKVRRFVRKQHEQISFDIFHHLTFNQYRTPSPGYWLDIPCVVGPVGGAETIPQVLWQDLEPHTLKKERIRTKGGDLKLFRWFNTRRKNRKMILCSSAENLKRLKPYSADSRLEQMPAIGFDVADFPRTEQTDSSQGGFSMLYAGKALDWKGIYLYLKALKLGLTDKGLTDFTVRLVGIRFEEEQKKVNGWIHSLGLEKQVELIPFIQRSELLKLEQNCSLSVYPAFRDSGSMSVLEACALGCPTICFNAGGQDIFPDDILLKIDVAESYDECVQRFADKLYWAYHHRDELRQIGIQAQKWVTENLTWKHKAEQMVGIYRKLGMRG